MLLNGYREFSVIYFTPELLRGGRFIRHDRGWKLLAYDSETVTPDNSEECWKNLLRKINSRRDGLLLLSGSLKGGLFFQMNSLPLPYREQRSAVIMELPRRLLSPVDNSGMQFAEYPLLQDCRLNVYLFPASSLEPLINTLISSGCRADEYCYPLLGLKPQDEPVYMPDLEKEYYFYHGSWHPVAGEEVKLASAKDYWRSAFNKEFVLPAEGDFTEKFMGVLLAARLAATGTVYQQRANLRALPERLHPIRYRRHLAISVILLILLLGSSLWHLNRTWGADYRKYRSTVMETRSLKSRADSMRKRMRKLNKEHKELLKVTEIYNETPNVLSQLALLSKTLPGNVVINRLRLSESSWDLTMQSEDERLNLPALINPLGIWKIEQLQQRQFGNSAVATISFKLTPLKPADREKKRK